MLSKKKKNSSLKNLVKFNFFTSFKILSIYQYIKLIKKKSKQKIMSFYGYIKNQNFIYQKYNFNNNFSYMHKILYYKATEQKKKSKNQISQNFKKPLFTKQPKAKNEFLYSLIFNLIIKQSKKISKKKKMSCSATFLFPCKKNKTQKKNIFFNIRTINKKFSNYETKKNQKIINPLNQYLKKNYFVMPHKKPFFCYWLLPFFGFLYILSPPPDPRPLNGGVQLSLAKLNYSARNFFPLEKKEKNINKIDSKTENKNFIVGVRNKDGEKTKKTFLKEIFSVCIAAKRKKKLTNHYNKFYQTSKTILYQLNFTYNKKHFYSISNFNFFPKVKMKKNKLNYKTTSKLLKEKSILNCWIYLIQLNNALNQNQFNKNKFYLNFNEKKKKSNAKIVKTNLKQKWFPIKNYQNLTRFPNCIAPFIWTLKKKKKKKFFYKLNVRNSTPHKGVNKQTRNTIPRFSYQKATFLLENFIKKEIIIRFKIKPSGFYFNQQKTLTNFLNKKKCHFLFPLQEKYNKKWIKKHPLTFWRLKLIKKKKTFYQNKLDLIKKKKQNWPKKNFAFFLRNKKKATEEKKKSINSLYLKKFLQQLTTFRKHFYLNFLSNSLDTNQNVFSFLKKNLNKKYFISYFKTRLSLPCTAKSPFSLRETEGLAKQPFFCEATSKPRIGGARKRQLAVRLKKDAQQGGKKKKTTRVHLLFASHACETLKNLFASRPFFAQRKKNKNGLFSLFYTPWCFWPDEPKAKKLAPQDLSFYQFFDSNFDPWLCLSFPPERKSRKRAKINKKKIDLPKTQSNKKQYVFTVGTRSKEKKKKTIYFKSKKILPLFVFPFRKKRLAKQQKKKNKFNQLRWLKEQYKLIYYNNTQNQNWALLLLKNQKHFTNVKTNNFLFLSSSFLKKYMSFFYFQTPFMFVNNFQKIGGLKKMLKIQQPILQSYSCIVTKKRKIDDFQYIYKKYKGNYPSFSFSLSLMLSDLFKTPFLTNLFLKTKHQPLSNKFLSSDLFYPSSKKFFFCSATPQQFPTVANASIPRGESVQSKKMPGLLTLHDFPVFAGEGKKHEKKHKQKQKLIAQHYKKRTHFFLPINFGKKKKISPSCFFYFKGVKRQKNYWEQFFFFLKNKIIFFNFSGNKQNSTKNQKKIFIDASFKPNSKSQKRFQKKQTFNFPQYMNTLNLDFIKKIKGTLFSLAKKPEKKKYNCLSSTFYSLSNNKKKITILPVPRRSKTATQAKILKKTFNFFPKEKKKTIPPPPSLQSEERVILKINNFFYKNLTPKSIIIKKIFPSGCFASKNYFLNYQNIRFDKLFRNFLSQPPLFFKTPVIHVKNNISLPSLKINKKWKTLLNFPYKARVAEQDNFFIRVKPDGKIFTISPLPYSITKFNELNYQPTKLITLFDLRSSFFSSTRANQRKKGLLCNGNNLLRTEGKKQPYSYGVQVKKKNIPYFKQKIKFKTKKLNLIALNSLGVNYFYFNLNNLTTPFFASSLASQGKGTITKIKKEKIFDFSLFLNKNNNFESLKNIPIIKLKNKKNLSIIKNIQKKRRAVKQRRETGRLLKRKRFFPRPIWLRFILYKKFLKFRHIKKKNITNLTNQYLQKSNLINAFAVCRAKQKEKEKNEKRKKKLLRLNIPLSPVVPPVGGKRRAALSLFAAQDQVKSFYDPFVLYEKKKISKAFLQKIKIINPKTYFGLNNFIVFKNNYNINQKKYYKISFQTLTEFKQELWKSSWLRSNLNLYLKKINQSLNLIKRISSLSPRRGEGENIKKKMYPINLTTFVLSYSNYQLNIKKKDLFNLKKKQIIKKEVQLFHNKKNLLKWETALKISEYNQKIYNRIQNVISHAKYHSDVPTLLVFPVRAPQEVPPVGGKEGTHKNEEKKNPSGGEINNKQKFNPKKTEYNNFDRTRIWNNARQKMKTLMNSSSNSGFNALLNNSPGTSLFENILMKSFKRIGLFNKDPLGIQNNFFIIQMFGNMSQKKLYWAFNKTHSAQIKIHKKKYLWANQKCREQNRSNKTKKFLAKLAENQWRLPPGKAEGLTSFFSSPFPFCYTKKEDEALNIFNSFQQIINKYKKKTSITSSATFFPTDVLSINIQNQKNFSLALIEKNKHKKIGLIMFLKKQKQKENKKIHMGFFASLSLQKRCKTLFVRSNSGLAKLLRGKKKSEWKTILTANRPFTILISRAEQKFLDFKKDKCKEYPLIFLNYLKKTLKISNHSLRNQSFFTKQNQTYLKQLSYSELNQLKKKTAFFLLGKNYIKSINLTNLFFKLPFEGISGTSNFLFRLCNSQQTWHDIPTIMTKKRTNYKTIKNITNRFLLASMVFHLCVFFSLVNISQIRCVLKLFILFSLKTSYFYLNLINSTIKIIFNQWRLKIKPTDIFYYLLAPPLKKNIFINSIFLFRVKKKKANRSNKKNQKKLFTSGAAFFSFFFFPERKKAQIEQLNLTTFNGSFSPTGRKTKGKKHKPSSDAKLSFATLFRPKGKKPPSGRKKPEGGIRFSSFFFNKQKKIKLLVQVFSLSFFKLQNHLNKNKKQTRSVLNQIKQKKLTYTKKNFLFSRNQVFSFFKINSLELISFILKKLIYKPFIFSYKLLFQVTDSSKKRLQSIYIFLETPGELLSDWITHLFLIEIASDLTTTIPENTDLAFWHSFTKISKTSSIRLIPILGTLLEKQLLNCFTILLKILSQPETDLMIRQQKSHNMGDIWGEILKNVAEKNNINITLLANKKEDQSFLLEKFLETNFLSLNHLKINSKKKNPLVLAQDIGVRLLFPFLLRKIKHIEKQNNSYLWQKKKTLSRTNNYGWPILYRTQIKKNLKFTFYSSAKNKLANIPFFPKGKTGGGEEMKQQWSASQFVTYKGKDSDLFIQAPPAPKCFKNIKAIIIGPTNPSYVTPTASLICQIYSGIFYKETAHSVLVVVSSLLPIKTKFNKKSLFIQSLAGETEIKIIQDNAKRYNSTFGIKALRTVFDALALHTPCIFLIEDIHIIGEKRSFLTGDNLTDSSNLAETTYKKQSSTIIGETGQEMSLDEKNLSLAKLTRHSVLHYNKPFLATCSGGKGNFLIPTNGAAFDFYLGASSAKTRQFNLTPLSPIKERFFITQNKEKIKKKNIKKSIPELAWIRPLTLLKTFEQSILKNQLIILPKPPKAYSIREKIALLAHLTVSKLSIKLNMITDLLVIIDSVRSNRGFVVFATTNKPALLDPALRRPGRFDETIILPFIPKLENRWEIIKATSFYYNKGLIEMHETPLNLFFFNPSFNFCTKTPFLASQEREINLAKQVAASFFASSSVCGASEAQRPLDLWPLGGLATQPGKAALSLRDQAKLFQTSFFIKKFTQFTNNVPLDLTLDLLDYGLFAPNYNHQAFYRSITSTKIKDKLILFNKIISKKQKNVFVNTIPKRKKNIKLPNQKIFFDLTKKHLQPTNYKQIKITAYSNIAQILIKNLNKIHSCTTKKESNTTIFPFFVQNNFFPLGREKLKGNASPFAPWFFEISRSCKAKKGVALQVKTPSLLTSLAPQAEEDEKRLDKKNSKQLRFNNQQGITSHIKPFLEQSFITFFTKKITELLTSPSKKSVLNETSYHHHRKISEVKNCKTTRHNTKTVFNSCAEQKNIFKSNKKDFSYSFPSLLKKKHKTKKDTPYYLRQSQGTKAKLQNLEGIDYSSPLRGERKAANSLFFSFIEKRFLYKKNLILPKLLNFFNGTTQNGTFHDPPSPPSSYILLPAKRYENYKRSFLAMQTITNKKTTYSPFLNYTNNFSLEEENTFEMILKYTKKQFTIDATIFNYAKQNKIKKEIILISAFAPLEQKPQGAFAFLYFIELAKQQGRKKWNFFLSLCPVKVKNTKKLYKKINIRLKKTKKKPIFSFLAATQAGPGKEKLRKTFFLLLAQQQGNKSFAIRKVIPAFVSRSLLGGILFPFFFKEGEEATFVSKKKKHKPEQRSCTPPTFGWGAKLLKGGAGKERKAALQEERRSQKAKVKLIKLKKKQKQLTSETQYLLSTNIPTLEKPTLVLAKLYRTKLLNRHRGYLNNQWWNGQLYEHNVENTFLSDVDWRSNFISSFHLKNEKSPFSIAPTTKNYLSVYNKIRTLQQWQNQKLKNTLFYNKKNFMSEINEIKTNFDLTSCEARAARRETKKNKSTLSKPGVFSVLSRPSGEKENYNSNILINFPDFDQHYNPVNRRWILNFGYWSYWYNFKIAYQNEIYSYIVTNSFLKTYNFLTTNREILDYLTTKIIKLGLIKEITIIDGFKRFI